ncbi:hypothetical protein ACTS9U_16810 [Empedobacter falsenii]|uniref:hypothetical protein n=1 Tax=Empedobacter TaxID=59734 RepID=UPI002447F882|nr:MULTISPECIES: hypothetical protein [Empedobacter]MDH1883656.1 hypothetical protein [Empedobacter sp. GD03797]MDM1042580.1 hypothetical protein [Empedobacter brevis]MDM1136510.1 hypothetical protein [Empedobacter sp. R750]
MKIKLLALTLSLLFLTNCNSYKSANSALVSGNFQQAFEQSTQAYFKNPSEKNGIKYVPLIFEAYNKGQQEDENRLKQIETLTNPSKYQEAYQIINRLQERQKTIAGIDGRSISGKTYNFKTKDYSAAYKTIQEKYAQFLYDEGKSFLNQGGKLNAQTAYQKFQVLESVYSNYKDTRSLMNTARTNGMYKVLVQLVNNTEVVIPKLLEKDLLDFNSYGLDSNWTEFYTGKLNSSYDYVIQLSFETINVSPEREKIEVHNFEKKIVDGKEELVQNGVVVKDKDGKPVMVDRYITVKSRFEEVQRIKEAAITARYYLIDNQKEQAIDSKNLVSQYIFRDSYGTYKGDRRSLDRDYINMIGRRPAPFPSNEQMIFDCGQDLKRKFKNEIIRMKL